MPTMASPTSTPPSRSIRAARLPFTSAASSSRNLDATGRPSQDLQSGLDEIDPSPRILSDHGGCSCALGRRAEGRADLRQALRKILGSVRPSLGISASASSERTERRPGGRPPPPERSGSASRRLRRRWSTSARSSRRANDDGTCCSAAQAVFAATFCRRTLPRSSSAFRFAALKDFADVLNRTPACYWPDNLPQHYASASITYASFEHEHGHGAAGGGPTDSTSAAYVSRASRDFDAAESRCLPRLAATTWGRKLPRAPRAPGGAADLAYIARRRPRARAELLHQTCLQLAEDRSGRGACARDRPAAQPTR